MVQSTDQGGGRIRQRKRRNHLLSGRPQRHEGQHSHRGARPRHYIENKVKYLCLDDTKGYAIVEGSKTYEVEFEYRDGEISSLTCSCFCGGSCKHEFAVMLQLKETLELIGKHYEAEYARTGYFAAINKGMLFALAVDGKESGSFTL